MQSKLSLYLQETASSCVPACLRMVLAGLGTVISEAELCQMCDCTVFGTEALQAVEAARRLGFTETHKENLTLMQVSQLVEREAYPIAYVGLMPIDKINGTHALVITKVSETSVTVLDPLVDERLIDKGCFEKAFRLTNGLAIVVR